MNDEQFQKDTEALRRGGYVSFVDDIRARDTAQREALARVEAKLENKTGTVDFLKRSNDRLAAQLAEAVGSVRQMPASAERNAFLARHAQAEQQDDGRTCRFCQKRFGSAGECGNHVDQFHHGEVEQQEAPKRGKPDWNSHSYDQIFQTSDGNWFGARAGWDFKGHISDGWKGREVSLLRDDGGFLAYGEPNPDWENSLEQRPAQQAQGAQAVDAQKEISGLIGFEFKPDELQTVNGDELLRVFWRGAALATQPAAYDQDQVHQLAFEVGEPDEDGDGYHFSAEQLDEFVAKLNAVRGAEQ